MSEQPLEADWFYTVPRFENELPLGTRVGVMGKNTPFADTWDICTGTVVGYRFDKGGLFPTGWHYIRFDRDTKAYNKPSAMPYVHRDYLEVIE